MSELLSRAVADVIMFGVPEKNPLLPPCPRLCRTPTLAPAEPRILFLLLVIVRYASW